MSCLDPQTTAMDSTTSQHYEVDIRARSALPTPTYHIWLTGASAWSWAQSTNAAVQHVTVVVDVVVSSCSYLINVFFLLTLLNYLLLL